MYKRQFLRRAAEEITKALQVNVIVFITKARDDGDPEKVRYRVRVIRESENEIRKQKHLIEIPRMPPSSVMQIREIMIEAVNRGILLKGDRVFCITDESLGVGFEGLIFVVTIDDRFLKFTEKDLKESIEKNVFETVLEIARELAREGREGKKVGTAFIIGDHENVLKRSKQMVLNPFRGYPPEERNITDPKLKETIKEFAQMDGVFIIDDEGCVHSAGAYLNVNTSIVDLPGLGARHHACAAITKVTDAVAVTVSESGGIVRVFRNGNLIMEEKPK